MKILIVDDSMSARFFLKSCIPEDRGFDLFEASNGQEGFETYKEERPDITFLDITMPVMDGFQAIEKIRAFDSDALVIILTSDVQKKTTERIMEKGAFLFLKKPPKQEQIQEAIEKAIRKLSHGR